MEKNMSKEDIKNMIIHALDEKPADLAVSFNNAISNKVVDAINMRRDELSQSMFNTNTNIDYTDDDIQEELEEDINEES